MKKIIALQVVSLALVSTMAQSNPPSDMPKLTPEQEYEIFTKDGLPLPGSGVHIIPLAKMQSVNLTQERSRIKSLTVKGYVDEYNSNAVELLTIQEAIKQDLISTGSNINPTNTHIHIKFEDMQIAYDYKAVPSTVAEESLGFAANGAYLNEKGWSGVVQFFKPKGLPSTDVCSYRQSNLQLTGGAANLAKELVTYIVNNKPPYNILKVSKFFMFDFSHNVEFIGGMEIYNDQYLIITVGIEDKDSLICYIDISNIKNLFS